MKDSYSCDRDAGGPRRRATTTTTRPTSRIVRAARARGDPGPVGRRDHGRQPAPMSSWSSTTSARTPSSCATTCDYADNQQIAVVPSPSPEPEEPPADGGRRDAGDDDDRVARHVPRHRPERTAKAAFFVTGDGRLRDRHRPRRLRRQRDEARERRLGDPAGSGRPRSRRSGQPAWRPGYGSPIGAHDTVVVVDDLVARSPNLVAGANRDGLARPERERAARLHAGRHVADITNAREGDPCPAVRRRADAAQRDRGRQHLQARDDVHRRRRGDVPRRGRRGAPHRHGLVRHRRRPQRGLHRRGAPRREGHRLAGAGGPVRRSPGRDRRRPRAARVRGRRAPPRDRGRGRRRARDPVGRPRRVARGQVHRCRAARHAVDPDRVAALAGRRRGGGDRTRDRVRARPNRSRRSRRSSGATPPSPVRDEVPA